MRQNMGYLWRLTNAGLPNWSQSCPMELLCLYDMAVLQSIESSVSFSCFSQTDHKVFALLVKYSQIVYSIKAGSIFSFIYVSQTTFKFTFKFEIAIIVWYLVYNIDLLYGIQLENADIAVQLRHKRYNIAFSIAIWPRTTIDINVQPKLSGLQLAIGTILIRKQANIANCNWNHYLGLLNKYD